MIDFQVDRADGLPAYRQLVRQVKEALRLGWLHPGDKLPVARDVVATSGVNANTVLKAYRELEHAGVVEMRQGSGTFVTAAMEAIDSGTLDELRTTLADWITKARAAGFTGDDMAALLRSILTEEESPTE